MHCADGERTERRTYSTSQDAECSLVDIHDGVVFPFVAVHLLKNMTKEEMDNVNTRLQEEVNVSHR